MSILHSQLVDAVVVELVSSRRPDEDDGDVVPDVEVSVAVRVVPAIRLIQLDTETTEGHIHSNPRERRTQS